MQRIGYFVAALLALAALTLDTLAVTSRCSASPGINISILLFGLAVQAVAVSFPLVFWAILANEPPRRGVAVIGMSLVLFVGGSLAFRYSALYSDAIGKPNYFKSAGLACHRAG
jgi:hypothetical protein